MKKKLIRIVWIDICDARNRDVKKSPADLKPIFECYGLDFGTDRYAGRDIQKVVTNFSYDRRSNDDDIIYIPTVNILKKEVVKKLDIDTDKYQ